MVFDTANLDNAELHIHLFGELGEQILIHIQALSDLGEACHFMNRVPLHQAASSSS